MKHGKIDVRSLVLICFYLLYTVFLSAQSKKIYTINPGEKVTDVIPANEIYKYPEFKTGIVTLRSGTFGKVKLNYHKLFGEIQFIDQKNDTLSLADEANILFIAIEKDTFYYEEAYLELIANYKNVRLAANTVIGFTNRKKIGPLNTTNEGSIATYTTIATSQYMKDLVANEILSFSEHTTYYFGDRVNHFFQANKKNLSKLFGKQAAKINSYLHDNPVNFFNEEDVKRLCEFLQGIDTP